MILCPGWLGQNVFGHFENLGILTFNPQWCIGSIEPNLPVLVLIAITYRYVTTWNPNVGSLHCWYSIHFLTSFSSKKDESCESWNCHITLPFVVKKIEFQNPLDSSIFFYWFSSSNDFLEFLPSYIYPNFYANPIQSIYWFSKWDKSINFLDWNFHPSLTLQLKFWSYKYFPTFVSNAPKLELFLFPDH